MIAYHEAGHALGRPRPARTPTRCTRSRVIPRGRALGYTLTLPEQDKFLMTREQLSDELAMLMGGRVAEEIVVGDITTGAANDIERATKIARPMVTEYGMSDAIGPLTLGQKQGEVFLGRDSPPRPTTPTQVAYDIDTEVIRLIDEAHDEALEILTSTARSSTTSPTCCSSTRRSTAKKSSSCSPTSRRGRRAPPMNAGPDRPCNAARRMRRENHRPSTPGTLGGPGLAPA